MKLSEIIKRYGDIDVNEAEVKEKLDIKDKAWQPKTNEVYYLISKLGTVISTCWIDECTDKYRYEIGNCFKNEEEAVNCIKKLKITAKLQRFAQENNMCKINWNDKNQQKYFIYYDHYSKAITTDWVIDTHRNVILFTSEEIARKAIELIGVEDLKKYYFGIED